MKYISVCAIVTALLAPLTAQSEGFYIGSNVGRAEQEAHLPAVSIKDSATAYKMVGGYNIHKNFGIETGYANLREVSAGVGEATYSSRPSAIYAAVVGILPLGDQFSVFGKLGAAHAHEKLSANFNGVYGSSYGARSHSRATHYIGVGASVSLNQRVSFVAEYENFGEVAKFSSSRIKADMFSLGLRYKF